MRSTCAGRGLRTVRDGAVVCRLEVAVGREGVADSRVLGFDEMVGLGVVEALLSGLASIFPGPVFGERDAYIAGDGAVGLAGPRANQIRRGLALRLHLHLQQCDS
jgi:hypothetical protein